MVRVGEPKTSGNQDVMKSSTNVYGLSYKKLDGMNLEYVNKNFFF